MKIYNLTTCFSIQDDDLSTKLQSKFSRVFNRIGYFSASHPIKTITISLIIIAALSSGVTRFEFEKNPLKLWVPPNDRFMHDSNWLLEKYKLIIREQHIIINAQNILEPKNILKLAKLNEMVTNLNVTLDDGSLLTYNDVCFHIPAIKELMETLKLINLLSNSSEVFTPVINMETDAFCEMVESLPQKCYQQNFLELWNYDEETLNNLTLAEISASLSDIETVGVESEIGFEINALQLLGEKVRDSNNRIIGASSIISTWFLFVNLSDIDYDEVGNFLGTEQWVSNEILQWEGKFISAAMEFKAKYEDGDFELHIKSGRSLGDVSHVTIIPEFEEILVSSVLMFVYMQLILSKFNWIELRFLLGSFGLLFVLLSTTAACGICGYLNMAFGPLHTSLPFLLMGLCVDDLFVIMACFRRVQQTNSSKNIADKLAKTLEQSGIAITVTSITDFLAFAIGYATEVPAIKSFCFASMVGVLIMYLLVLTAFMAIFALDEKRIEARRNAFFPFIKHGERSMKRWMDRNLMQSFFIKLYSRVILTKLGKTVILIFIAVYSCIGFNSMLKLEQGSKPNFLLGKDSYLYDYEEMLSKYYPTLGYEAGIFMENINYPAVMPNLIQLADQLEHRDDLLLGFKSWIIPFSKFVWLHYKIDLSVERVTEDVFRLYLSKFLYSTEGGKYQANFRFVDELECGKLPSNISISQLEFAFKKGDLKRYMAAKQSIEDMIEAANITTTPDGYASVWGKIFALWILDDLINKDFIINIGLTLICVMACTVLLILNFQVCLWIFVCVILTVINVCGYAQIMGIQIEVTFFIGLQFGVGLCVDYASHIGHTFIHIKGESRQEKALKTIENIGAAVFYGSTSTLLAILPLTNSPSLLVVLFTRIFFLVILFGMIHGLLLMPIILSIIGPTKSHAENSEKKSKPTECCLSVINTKL